MPTSSATRRRPVTKQKPLSKAERAKRLREYDPDFLDCRADVHTWSPLRPGGKLNGALEIDGKYLVTRRKCKACGTERSFYINMRTWEVEERRYDYPEGFTLDRFGKQRPKKPEWRQEYFGPLIKELRKRNGSRNG